MRAMPIDGNLHAYSFCCSKTLCCGCAVEDQNKKPGCAFCRTAVAKTNEEMVARLHKRVELKDPAALFHLAMAYGYGQLGLSVDQVRCIELLRESVDLCYPPAQRNLGALYHNGEMGLERNIKAAIKHSEKAAAGGDIESQHYLGCAEVRKGNHVAAMRHWRLAASGGYKPSMDCLIECFEDGLLRQGDLAETLRATYHSRAELRSEDRDRYVKHLKENERYGLERMNII